MVVKYHKKVRKNRHKALASYSVKKCEEGDHVGRLSATNPVSGALRGEKYCPYSNVCLLPASLVSVIDNVLPVTSRTGSDQQPRYSDR